MDRTQAEKLWAQWTAMWNGELGLASALVGEGFRIHLPGKTFMDPAAIRDARGVVALVSKVRESYRALRYETNGAVLVDGDSLVARWFGIGTYAGKTGRPGDEAGKEFRMAGMDILRIEDGRVQECWTLGNPIEE